MTTIGYLEVLVDRAASEVLGRPITPDSTAGLGASGRGGGVAGRATEGLGTGTRARLSASQAPSPGALNPGEGDLSDPYDPGDSWRLEQVVESVLGDLPEDGSETPWAPWFVAMEMLGLFGLGPTRPGNEPMPGGLQANRAECRRRLAAWLDSRRSTT